MASGIIVSKVQGETSASEDIVGNLFADIKALLVAAIASGIFGLAALVGIFNLPAWPFIVISACISLAIYLDKNPEKKSWVRDYGTLSGRIFSGAVFPEKAKVLTLPNKIDFSVFKLEVDSEISNYLAALENGKSNVENLHEYYRAVSEEFYLNNGVTLPKLEVVQTNTLSRSGYRVLVRENEVQRGYINLGLTMLDCSRSIAATLGFAISNTAQHPIRNSQVVHVDKSQKGLESIESLGIKAHRPYQVLVLTATGGMLKVIEEIFGVDESKELVNQIKGSTNLVDEIFKENKVSFPEYAELMRRLVSEGVNIRDQKWILESVVEFLAFHPQSNDRQEWLEEMHLHVRKGVSRLILRDCLAPGDKLRVFLLAEEVEQGFRSALRLWEGVRSLPPLAPELESVLRENILRVITPIFDRGALPIVVLCAQGIRCVVQEFLLRYIGAGAIIKAISFDEVGNRHNSEVIGLLGIST